MSLDLTRKLAQRMDDSFPALARLDLYYTGNQPLSFLHPEIQANVRGRLQNLAINWPRVIVGSIEERLDVEGFRLGSDEAADRELWRIWQANDLDEWSQLAITDAMVHGRAFLSVWAGEDDPATPRIAVESARQMVVSYKAGTRTVDAALKVWRDDGVQHAVLYLPEETRFYALDVADDLSNTNADRPYKTDGTAVPNPLGVVPVVPLVNRPRLMDLTGESELSDVLPMADAVNKLATDMMVSSEYHAMPRRWITGMEVPREGGPQNRVSAEIKAKLSEAYPGKPWVGGDVTFGQFPEASLSNFIQAIHMLTGQIAAVAGLPPHYLGLSSDNPASADAIRSAESSLVKKAERKMRSFGASFERAMRLAIHVRDGKPADDLAGLETIWRDPSTPTPAQKADAAVKLTTGDRPIITVNQAREDLGYSPAQIERMVAEEQSVTDAASTQDVRAKVAVAQDLMATQGLSQAAAYAAVGLLVAANQISADAGTTPAA